MTPRNTSGRIVAAIVMLEGIALLTIVTAAITSIFVARAAQERHIAEAGETEEAEARMNARFDKLDARLDHVEALLRSPKDG